MTIHKEELWRKLILDIRDLGLPINDVDLCIRPYSKIYYGNYYPQYDSDIKPRVYVYPCKNRKGELYDYDFILDTVIHEMVHHVQHTSPDFVRLKGVMHNQEFWQLYNRYIYRAKIIGVISDEYESKAA